MSTSKELCRATNIIVKSRLLALEVRNYIFYDFDDTTGNESETVPKLACRSSQVLYVKQDLGFQRVRWRFPYMNIVLGGL